MDDQATFVPFARPDIGEAEIEAVVAALRSGWLTTGPNSAAFEREFGEFLGVGLHAVAVNSATAALHLAVDGLGLGPGDEVLVPTWTFTATAEIVRYTGATPVMVDIDPGTLNLDFAAAERAVTSPPSPWRWVWRARRRCWWWRVCCCGRSARISAARGRWVSRCGRT